MFADNFDQFANAVPPEVLRAGPNKQKPVS
jgi:hypothetical protein